MKPFDEVFPDVAARTVRVVVRGTRRGQLREYYCAVPGCACRKAVVAVYADDGRRIEAVIGFAFDQPAPYFLPDDYDQGPDAKDWIPFMVELLDGSPDLRAQLREHCELVKRAVGGEARTRQRRGPTARTTVPRKTPAKVSSSDAALVIAATVRGESKEQAKFKRLLAKVDGLREQLRAWTRERPNIDRELAICAAAFDEMVQTSRELLLVLVKTIEVGKLSKRDRKEASALVVELADGVLENRDDAEVKAIYNRFARSDFDREVAQADQLDVEIMKSVLQGMGLAAGESKAASLDELREAAQVELEARERTREERRAQRKRTPRQMAAEARRADEERGADKALQAVFRELARALHPDHEQDPLEAQRKSELMREVNAAYEANDLLALLSLQLRLENVDTSAATGIAEERVRHYVRVLARQEAQLAAELDAITMPFRSQLGLGPRAKVMPALVVGRIRQDTLAVRDQTAMLREDRHVFGDAAALKAWLAQERRGY